MLLHTAAKAKAIKFLGDQINGWYYIAAKLLQCLQIRRLQDRKLKQQNFFPIQIFLYEFH